MLHSSRNGVVDMMMNVQSDAADSLRVHVVDQQADASRYVADMLTRQAFIVQCWPSVAEFADACETAAAGCVVIDPFVGDIDIAALQDRLAAPDIGMPSVIVTACTDMEAVVGAMRRGAIDVIAKPVDEARLYAAIGIARYRLRQAQRRAATMRRVQAALDMLSSREREVLAGLTRGWSNKEIARRLAISARTVEIHRANVMDKLDAQSLSQALRIAFIAQVCSMVNPALHVD